MSFKIDKQKKSKDEIKKDIKDDISFRSKATSISMKVLALIILILFSGIIYIGYSASDKNPAQEYIFFSFISIIILPSCMIIFTRMKKIKKEPMKYFVLNTFISFIYHEFNQY